RRAPADHTQARHGTAASGRTGPASSKPQPMSELRNHPRKLTPNSATFTRTGQSPSGRPDLDSSPPIPTHRLQVGRRHDTHHRVGLVEPLKQKPFPVHPDGHPVILVHVEK